MTAQEQHKADLFFSWLGSVEDHMAYGDKQFYTSLYWQHENRKKNTSGLSSSQLYHLERLYNKYSAEEITKKEEFKNSYSDDHRLVAVRCAEYYKSQHPVYYDNIATKVMEDPKGHILTYAEYNKMCNNKYAKKILSAYDEPAKFAVGDIVQIRASNRVDLANFSRADAYPRQRACSEVRNKTCMVLEPDALPITRPAKGARIYKILIIGEGQPIYAHESDLKNIRRSRK